MTDYGDNFASASSDPHASDTSYDSGRVGEFKDEVRGQARELLPSLQSWMSDAPTLGSWVRDALTPRSWVGDAPAQPEDKGRGNPLAAGLIAFGIGLLVSGLIPSSQKERQAVSTLQEKAEPLKEEATEAAKQVAENLKEPAAKAALSARETAAEAVQIVKGEGASARQDVQGQLQASAEMFKKQRQSG